MTIALATAWHPRGELNRFLNLLPLLQQEYSGMAFSLPPEVEPDLVNHLQDLPQVNVLVTPDWSWGRYSAIQMALEFSATHLQYADFDRLLRWVETRPDEWQQVLRTIQEHDCLLIGRSPASYQTHPQALIETEAISNRVISYLVGQSLDVSAGSKGFSREACQTILGNSKPGYALGTDAEWPLILVRSGYQVDYIAVDGLDWESADRYRLEAADQQSQKEAAELYDADPQNWSRRVAVAMEIVQVGLDTATRELKQTFEQENS
ncbi:MAG: hypothetical protein WA997_06210 [Anaerolineales bacterium]